MRKSTTIIFLIILASFVVSLYFYSQMPERMVSHWGFNNQPNGSSPKFLGLFIMPIISLILFLFFISIPKIDPLKANIEKFRKYYDWFIAIFILFFFYIHLLRILWNIGARFDMGQMMIPAMAILFYFCGVLIEKSKRNWFIGIRTPWTLSSDIVWEKTHKIGGKLFKVSGIICLMGIFFPKQAFFFIIIPIIFSALYSVFYSYFEHKKLL